jgi:uncharacterized protein
LNLSLKAMDDRLYYVYVYIDPRNFEEFYYGKGKGSRKISHLFDEQDSKKVARIRAIREEGLAPIIRTVAAGLNESEAHLIETTLIWKLGRTLTNSAAGHFTSLFRPQNSFHRELPGFDFQNRVYYFNVGESKVRCWEDCRKFGFISAGQGRRWRDQIIEFQPGDVVVAYLKRCGYVGIGKVLDKAVRYLDFRINGKPLNDCKLSAPEMFKHADDVDRSEYVVAVDWKRSFPRDQARWKKRSHLFTTQLVRARLDRQRETLDFVEREFDLCLKDLVI